MKKTKINAAYKLLENSILMFEGRPVGTIAAMGGEDSLAAKNYNDCFIRDFVPCALVFLADGRSDIVRNFLETVLQLRTSEIIVSGHEVQPGVMPASFRVRKEGGKEILQADFGERAIGRVAPVDSMMWWIILLHVYVQHTGDMEMAKRPEFQRALQQILHLCLKDNFEVSPALLVPDACCMIDRRMGIYGHPLEIQALFYGILRIFHTILDEPAVEKRRRAAEKKESLIQTAETREHALKNYVRIFYWLDMTRLNEIHRYPTEELGSKSTNVLNVYPESIPDWVLGWLPDEGGYLVGNVGAGRMDFRYFALGNLLSILFELTTNTQAERIMRLYDARWDDLVGSMPVKITFPTMDGIEWEIRTGCDPKNVSWSYQNGGNWPALLWIFVAAALKTGRGDLAERAYQCAYERLCTDTWPEYYDGRDGRLIGRRSNVNQTWTAASLILSHKLLEDPDLLSLLPG
ncbi:MAG: glycoside hydrolase 100 family protein [Gammaproteobacteria bacterium]|nr:MAG: glycoside hydrolase 100 family protein [Gammaproteobacteria bacterium]